MEQQTQQEEPQQTWSKALWNVGRNAALNAADYVTPVRTTSAYKTKGVLTPQEFADAGDMLVARCPTWAWATGEPNHAKPYLPPDKQFLITKNVPCQRRVRALGLGADVEELVAAGGDGADDDDEAWVATHAGRTQQPAAEVPDLDSVADATASPPPPPSDAAAAAAASSSSLGLEALGLGLDEADDPSALPASSSNIVRSRTYDLSITYDKYYQCARVWLFGYSEARQPLTQAELLEDISADHALKTVTLESHPHMAGGAGLHVSLHPCKHASVMLKLCQELAAAGKECRPDQYLFLFLKFISSVIPTVEYDYTVSVELGR